jgi:hypothetical protein
MNATNYYNDIERGKPSEELFQQWATLHNLKIQDVRDDTEYRNKDIDFILTIRSTRTIDVKKSLDDDEFHIPIQEYKDVETQWLGWFYRSEADCICFADVPTRTLVFLSMTPEMKSYYETIKDRFELLRNKPTKKGNRTWQSAFRVIPMVELKQFIVVKSLNR